MSNVATTAKVKASIEIIHNFSTFSTIIFPVILQNSIILIDKYIKYYDWTISDHILFKLDNHEHGSSKIQYRILIQYNR